MVVVVEINTKAGPWRVFPFGVSLASLVALPGLTRVAVAVACLEWEPLREPQQVALVDWAVAGLEGERRRTS